MQSKTYPLDPEQAISICARIFTQSGIKISSGQPIGTVETHGCVLSWAIANGNITVTVLSKPFYVSTSTIFGELDQLFSTAGKD